MNLPNKLTIVRMLLVPVIVFLWLGIDEIAVISVFGSDISIKHFICAILFIVASVTDLLDGQIARKNNLVTTFGKFMDPIADKLLVNTLLILMAYERLIPVLCVLFMISRDLIVDAVRLMAAQNQIVMAAGPLGKIKTVCQMIAIPLLLVDHFPLGWLPFQVGTLMIWVATLVSIVSGYDYFMKNKDMIFESI